MERRRLNWRKLFLPAMIAGILVPGGARGDLWADYTAAVVDAMREGDPFAIYRELAPLVPYNDDLFWRDRESPDRRVLMVTWGGDWYLQNYKPGDETVEIHSMTSTATYCAFPDPIWGGDYNGDGTPDLAVFRGSTGLWAVRGVTRFYFGAAGDLPVPADYREDGTAAAGVFRPSSGLWAARGATRVYFGDVSDRPVPADYNGDGLDQPAVFRESRGLWAVKDAPRIYYGAFGDTPATR